MAGQLWLEPGQKLNATTLFDKNETKKERNDRMRKSKTNIHNPAAMSRVLSALIAGSTLAVLLLGPSRAALAQCYLQTNLDSDVAGMAEFTDTNLVGAWGIVHSSTSPWWVNTTVSGLSLLFNGAGQAIPLVVAIPPTNPATATGIVFNGGTNFLIKSNLPAVFLFATLNGAISGWNPGLSNRLLAVIEVDNSATAGYTGLTLAQTTNGEDRLYAADYIQDKIDVFDGEFNAVTLPSGAFTDQKIPAGFHVFNIQHINDDLYVTYAPTNVFGSPGAPGQGFVDVFDVSGTLVRRLEHGCWMDAPWGVALAPADFGKFSNRILVGMFNTGQIAAFSAEHGRFRGVLRGPDGAPVANGKGLWGLGFGNNASAGPTNTLYFASDFLSTNGLHGLFGAFTAGACQDVDDDQGRAQVLDRDPDDHRRGHDCEADRDDRDDDHDHDD